MYFIILKKNFKIHKPKQIGLQREERQIISGVGDLNIFL